MFWRLACVVIGTCSLYDAYDGPPQGNYRRVRERCRRCGRGRWVLEITIAPYREEHAGLIISSPGRKVRVGEDASYVAPWGLI